MTEFLRPEEKFYCWLELFASKNKWTTTKNMKSNEVNLLPAEWPAQDNDVLYQMNQRNLSQGSKQLQHYNTEYSGASFAHNDRFRCLENLETSRFHIHIWVYVIQREFYGEDQYLSTRLWNWRRRYWPFLDKLEAQIVKITTTLVDKILDIQCNGINFTKSNWTCKVRFIYRFCGLGWVQSCFTIKHIFVCQKLQGPYKRLHRISFSDAKANHVP